MNIEGGFRGQGVHRIAAALLVTVLAFGLLFGVSGLSGAAADPIDFDHACSIRAIAGSPGQAADLAGKLQIDLYRISVFSKFNLRIPRKRSAYTIPIPIRLSLILKRLKRYIIRTRSSLTGRGWHRRRQS